MRPTDPAFDALKAWAKADAAAEAYDEILERACAEDWINDPTGSMHVNSARQRADDAMALARKMRDAALDGVASPSEAAGILPKLERIDGLLADRYARARERGDESAMDALAAERVGLQTAIRIFKESLAA